MSIYISKKLSKRHDKPLKSNFKVTPITLEAENQNWKENLKVAKNQTNKKNPSQVICKESMKRVMTEFLTVK